MDGGIASLYGAAFLVTAVSLIPLLFVVWASVEAGRETIIALVFRPRVAELLANTFLVLAISTPLCAALALALAWLTERTDLPGARVFAWLNVAPLAIPAFVHGYGWVSAFPGFHGLSAGVLLSILAYYPFLYMPVAATMRRLDPALEDTAASLGLRPHEVFWRGVLPQLKLPLAGGSLLFGLHILAEYGLYAMVRLDTFTTAIVDQFQSTYNSIAADMLAAVLVLFALCLLIPESLLRGRERYARLGSGAARPPLRHRLGHAWPLCMALSIFVCVLALGVPLVTLTRWLLAGRGGSWDLAAFGGALVQTALLAAVGGIATTAAAIPTAWLSVRAAGKTERGLETATYFVGSLPGVVVSLALVFVTVRVAYPLYQTSATLLLAYVIIFLPRALISLRSSIAQVPVELEEAAVGLGRSPARAILEVTLRLAAPGALTAFALVGLGITNELTATLLLSPDGTSTLATQFWAYSAELDYAAAAPYAVVMILLSIPMTVILYARVRTEGTDALPGS
jgi:iron(III) transport system permease protein